MTSVVSVVYTGLDGFTVCAKQRTRNLSLVSLYVLYECTCRFSESENMTKTAVIVYVIMCSDYLDFIDSCVMRAIGNSHAGSQKFPRLL